MAENLKPRLKRGWSALFFTNPLFATLTGLKGASALNCQLAKAGSPTPRTSALWNRNHEGPGSQAWALLDGGPMKSRDVVGKRIVRVDQERMRSGGGRQVWVLLRIVLEDGTTITATTVEPDYRNYTEYGTEMRVWKPEKETT